MFGSEERENDIFRRIRGGGGEKIFRGGDETGKKEKELREGGRESCGSESLSSISISRILKGKNEKRTIGAGNGKGEKKGKLWGSKER